MVIITHVPGYTLLTSRDTESAIIIPTRVGRAVEVLIKAPEFGSSQRDQEEFDCVQDAVRDIEDPSLRLLAIVFARIRC